MMGFTSMNRFELACVNATLQIFFFSSDQDLMVGEPSSKIKSDQFKKVGVISQAEFENQRGERVGGDEERHQVATNDDDLQFELDEPEPDKKPKSTESDSCSGPGNPCFPLQTNLKFSSTRLLPI